MTPIKTKPVSRKDVLRWLNETGKEHTMDELHDSERLAELMRDIKIFNGEPMYHNVMGALLHFWKQAKGKNAKS